MSSAGSAQAAGRPGNAASRHSNAATPLRLPHVERTPSAPTSHTTTESWSRGTRVLQRQNGKWAMIHQHVSYPYDPRTGEARTDLRP
ncbi:nuclear transport factor 2 family protein [Streptomyces rubiginosohelvolus]|uniref:nuclear transport factor 2 family protein n=1 Tax=Streptomyces rubiginosohelvolus TaxID=67362 RepID=UPI0033BA3DFB